MLWIGLTGGIASGKSSVARVFVRMGIPVVSADVLAHEVLEPGSEAVERIVELFGRSVRANDGGIDRHRLGEIVFVDPTGAKLRALEQILHPQVRKKADELRQELRHKGHSVAVYEVPLLFEKDMQGLFDKIVCVAVRPEVQVQRLVARNHISSVEAYQRIRKQADLSMKLAGSDIVIWNNGQTSDLERIAESVARDLLTSSKRLQK
ncbi:MAG: dephospho-CoA kinase [Bdellovibrionaceae bacterium]|nr:dephospho-CoA kinase [Pseudobdellovibrionaceae bacterium]